MIRNTPARVVDDVGSRRVILDLEGVHILNLYAASQPNSIWLSRARAEELAAEIIAYYRDNPA